ncbi:Alcohol dehydrogenase protein [Aspergillus mulundensis]|uniref:Alcohol dehydrogenase protein n=1 Tax=Aspergillus mulundensis TaxID=1810919 RepID=A0A3D8SUC8_9EURO|nr:Alcohol dehydrogenase protein [Aspergillus mulundensis]RDW89923.1 Alcohol dehydrogenase protein [Aspergillus mulundensis]
MSLTMRAVAQFGTPFNVSVIDRPMPTILNGTDVIVRMNASAICGSDLHSYRAASGSEEHPYLYGHEGIGHVVEVGDSVQFLSVGDYVVIPDNFDNGHFTTEPDVYVPSLSSGGVEGGGALPGLQAEYARIPFADNSLIPVPVTDTTNTTTLIDYLFTSDIFATAWSGVTWSGFEPGDTIAVFGAGPVGLLAAYSALLRGASRVYSIDRVRNRLSLAESIGAIPINFEDADPVAQILALEPNGVRRGVEAVGYEAVDASGAIDSGITVRQLINVTAPRGGIGVVGLFSSGQADIDYGAAYAKMVSVSGGIVLPLQVAGEIVPLINSGQAHPGFIVTSVIGIEEAPEYYQRFNRTEESKVVIGF